MQGGDNVNSYDLLLTEAYNNSLIVKEKNLIANDGLIKGNRIAIRKNIPTTTEKMCVLAEELGHYHTSVGNIIDMNVANNRKQEHMARAWAYEKMITLEYIIEAFSHGCRELHDFSEYMNVTEAFLIDAFEYFKQKYGCYKKVGEYTLIFYPHFDIMKSF